MPKHHSGPAIIYQQEITSQATDKCRILTGSAWLFQPSSRTFENIPTVCYGKTKSEWVPPINKLVFLPYLKLPVHKSGFITFKKIYDDA